jgi:hypothetical protein
LYLLPSNMHTCMGTCTRSARHFWSVRKIRTSRGPKLCSAELCQLRITSCCANESTCNARGFVSCTPHHLGANFQICGTERWGVDLTSQHSCHLYASAGHVIGHALAGRRVQQLDLRHDGQRSSSASTGAHEGDCAVSNC